jgi:tetratricopeptide (TPR) repeat protein
VAALAALLLAAGAVAAIALTGGRSSDRGTASTPTASTGTHTTAKKKQHTTSASSATKSSTTQAKSTPATTSTAPSGSSASKRDPKALNDQGFALINQGNNAAAVPLLQQSVQGFRDSGRTGEIDYAFALFNLATALRATGHPDQAIPLLEERLQRSDYKRGVVERELAAARQQAGQPPGSSPAKKAKPGKKDNRGPGKGGGEGND